jgi:hypothetical protein
MIKIILLASIMYLLFQMIPADLDYTEDIQYQTKETKTL